jgi:hypothetical protein
MLSQQMLLPKTWRDTRYKIYKMRLHCWLTN